MSADRAGYEPQPHTPVTDTDEQTGLTMTVRFTRVVYKETAGTLYQRRARGGLPGVRRKPAPGPVVCAACGVLIEQESTDIWEDPTLAHSSDQARYCPESPNHLHVPEFFDPYEASDG